MKVSLTYLGQILVRKCKISFSHIHREKVEKIYAEVLEDIAKDRNGQQFDYFASEVKKIYEYARKRDIKSAVLRVLNKTLWKGGNNKDFNDFPLKPHQKEEIIKITMEELEITYS